MPLGVRSPRQRLPVRPKPLPDEWLGSWLARLADANASALPDLLDYLGLDAKKTIWTKRDFQILEQVTGHSGLAELWTPIDQIKADSSAFLGAGTLRICPQCIRTDEQPYIRREWLRSTFGACTTHQVLLESTCPQCRRPIRLIAAAGIRRAASHLSYPHANLRRCTRCHGDLSATTPQQASVLAVTPPATILQKRVTQAVWVNFESAFRLMVATFRLDTVLSPGSLRLGPLGQANKAITQQASLQMQQLIAWMLAGETDSFVVRHQRLRATVSALLGLLDEQAELPSERRWMYTAWLLTRLRDDTSEAVLLYWPSLSRFLCKRYSEPASAEIATRATETYEGVRHLKPDERKAIASLLGGNVTYRMIQGRNQKTTRLLDDWNTSGLLRQHMNSLCQQISNDDPLLKADYFIELARRISPSLHRRLVFKLGVRYAKKGRNA